MLADQQLLEAFGMMKILALGLQNQLPHQALRYTRHSHHVLRDQRWLYERHPALSDRSIEQFRKSIVLRKIIK